MEIQQLVRARGRRWHVADVRTYESCRLLTLNAAPAEPCPLTRAAVPRRSCRLLTPFDEVAPIPAVTRPRRVGRPQWRRACRALLASSAAPGELLSPVRSHFDLLPYQLQPAISILRGRATRVLLADEVGLGKTVQAGLVFAELIVRGRADRVLILTPAGLRDQWAAELASRFGLDAVVADAAGMRQLARTLPLDVNPWTTTPVAIASIDYVKRPEVLPAVAACRWDVVVVDEAHAAVGDSERREALRLLAARAAHVLLLTATPHSGDARAYEALCTVGAAPGDRLLVFRRTRRNIHGGAGRRTLMLRIRAGGAERRMLGALSAYHAAVQREHGSRALELAVLDKRAFSSAWSLAESVDRRLSRLAGAGSGDEDGRQLMLPLDADGETSSDDSPPDWPSDLELSDSALERRLLDDLSESARAASAVESKLAALARLLRRSGESALVFTEYRDTALHVSRRLGGVPVLHGGLARDERRHIVNAFNSGAHPVVVATDAGGLGLNLQRRCRLVVNLELPWNPTRLEQRIGRVDRIGQQKRVHAVQLVGRDTGEMSVLARLQQRTSTAGRVLGDEIGPDYFAAEAHNDAARLATIRQLADPGDSSVLAALENSRWWIVKGRRRLRLALAGRTIFFFRARTLTGRGGVGAPQLIAVAAPSRSENDPVVQTAARAVAAGRLAARADIDQAYWRIRLEREEWIAASDNNRRLAAHQPGLFNHQMAQLRSAARSDADGTLSLERRRLAAIREQATIRGHAVDLMLVLDS